MSMVQPMCSQCNLDTSGNHEWNCPFNRNNSVPVPRVLDEVTGDTCDHNFEFGILKPRAYSKGIIFDPTEDVIVICSFCGEVRLEEIK